MQRFIVYVAAIACAAAFLFMAKLMHDMNGHMAGMTDHVARMSADMGRMTSHMDTLVSEVSTIKDSVRFMAPMAADIQPDADDGADDHPRRPRCSTRSSALTGEPGTCQEVDRGGLCNLPLASSTDAENRSEE